MERRVLIMNNNANSTKSLFRVVINDDSLSTRKDKDEPSESALDSNTSEEQDSPSKEPQIHLQGIEFMFTPSSYDDHNIPILSLSNGDDYAGLIPVKRGGSLSYAEPLYYDIAGMIYSLTKSLAGKVDGEVNRNEVRASSLIEIKNNSNIPDGVYVTNTKPTARALCPNAFTEDYPDLTPLISACAFPTRLLNLNLMVGLSQLIEMIIDLDIAPYKLFTESFSYVPVYNVKHWVDAGKPKNSPYHVRINNMRQAFKIAGYECFFLDYHSFPYTKDEKKEAQIALWRAFGLSYNQSLIIDLDHESYLFDSRLCRMIEGFRRNDKEAIIKAENEVVVTQSFNSFFNPDNENLTETNVEEVYAQRYKSC